MASLSRTGDRLSPRPLNGFVETGTEGAFVPRRVSQEAAGEGAGEVEIVRPIFEPGDALLFDEAPRSQVQRLARE